MVTLLFVPNKSSLLEDKKSKWGSHHQLKCVEQQKFLKEESWTFDRVLKLASGKVKICYALHGNWLTIKITDICCENGRRMKYMIWKLGVGGIWYEEDLSFGQKWNKGRKGLDKLVNGTYVAVQSANINEYVEYVVTLQACSQSNGSRAWMIV